METPLLIGQLRSTLVKNTEHFSFTYDKAWLNSTFIKQIDPELKLYAGEQHSSENKNFRVFLDSCPDRWGRLLMKRRESIFAKKEHRKPKTFFEIDFLLSVHDQYRMGGIRFSKNLIGPFLDNNQQFVAPPLSTLSDLEQAKIKIEEDNCSDDEYLKWISMLISPGSSLGGARPKCCVVDENNHLWIAKFPSKFDEYDVGLWEYVAYKLAINAGVNMAPSSIMRFEKHHHTFLTKRFQILRV
jgi:serine/threonine-protein kinase HipA